MTFLDLAFAHPYLTTFLILVVLQLPASIIKALKGTNDKIQ